MLSCLNLVCCSPLHIKGQNLESCLVGQVKWELGNTETLNFLAVSAPIYIQFAWDWWSDLKMWSWSVPQPLDLTGYPPCCWIHMLCSSYHWETMEAAQRTKWTASHWAWIFLPVKSNQLLAGHFPQHSHYCCHPMQLKIMVLSTILVACKCVSVHCRL